MSCRGSILIESIVGISVSVIAMAGIFGLLSRSIAINKNLGQKLTATYLAAEAARQANCKVVFSGQGSDEVFAGYSAYKDILAKSGFPAVEEEIWATLSNLWNRNLYRDDALTARHSLELRVPFLDTEFLRQAMAFPASEKIADSTDSIRKHPVRALAREFGLPEYVWKRPKKALQYGSGLGKEVGRLYRA